MDKFHTDVSVLNHEASFTTLVSLLSCDVLSAELKARLKDRGRANISHPRESPHSRRRQLQSLASRISLPPPYMLVIICQLPLQLVTAQSYLHKHACIVIHTNILVCDHTRVRSCDHSRVRS